MARPLYVSIDAPFAGFAPAYWENTYAAFGNRNHARAMVNIDMTDPTGFQQGPGLTTLTDGTEAGGVTTLIKHILNSPPSSGLTYGIGGNKLIAISPAAVSNSGIWPHTINKAAVTAELGESSFQLNGALYYLYNHSGAAGDIGKYDLNVTFDDDWGSTVPTGMAALASAPHPSVTGNDNVGYFGNGRYVGYYDADTNTLDTSGLDLPVGSEVVDVRYKDSRVWAIVNFPNIADSNSCEGIIYVWGGVGVPSWDDFPNPRIRGRFGAAYVKNSTMFVWYQETGFTGGYKLGYVRGNEIVQLKSYSGSLPNFGQVGEHKGHLAWVSDGLAHLWGATDMALPAAHSQYCDLGYSTVGAMASPFGTLMAASNQSTSYKVAKLSGLDVTSSWKSLMFQTGPATISKVRVHHSLPSTGARADVKLTRDQGLETITLSQEGATGSITASADANRCYKTFSPNLEVQDEVSVEVDFANGSATNALKIRRIEMWGLFHEKD